MAAPVPTATDGDHNNESSSSMSLDELRAKLKRLQRQRQTLQETTRQEHLTIQTRLLERVHSLEHDHKVLQEEARAWKIRRHVATKCLHEESQTWNAMNDAFCIWHQGPFATMNGVRLGSEAAIIQQVAVPTTNNNVNKVGGTGTAGNNTNNTAAADSSSTSSMFGAMAATVSLPGRYLGFSSSTDPNSTHHDHNNNHSDNSAAATTATHSSSSSSAASTMMTTTTSIRVPWTEINSALGQIVLLLKLLEQSPHAGIHFPHHVLIPQGSTSKIGLRQPNAITGWGIVGKSNSADGTGSSGGASEIPIVALYHLYSDDSFSLFGKRNFNLALRALVECVALAAKAIHARDRTIVMPFPMQVEHDNPSAPCTIGGLPVQYGAPSTTTTTTTTTTVVDGGDNHSPGVTWTRAMKYLLTNVKWCVAYTAKHVDR